MSFGGKNERVERLWQLSSEAGARKEEGEDEGEVGPEEGEDVGERAMAASLGKRESIPPNEEEHQESQFKRPKLPPEMESVR